MEPYEKADPDRKIRESFEPDAETVRRVVGHALAARERRRHRLAPALAAAGIGIAAWFIICKAPGPSPETSTLSCVGDVAILQAPDGTSWVYSENERQPDSSTELGLILYEGDLP